MNDAMPSSKKDLPAVLADIEATSGRVRQLLLDGVALTAEDWLMLAEFCFSALALCWEQGLTVQRRQP